MDERTGKPEELIESLDGVEVTELDDKDLENVAGGLIATGGNTNCGCGGVDFTGGTGNSNCGC